MATEAEGMHDLAHMSNLSEDALVDVLKTRLLTHKLVYTRVHRLLIALNPLAPQPARSILPSTHEPDTAPPPMTTLMAPITLGGWHASTPVVRSEMAPMEHTAAGAAGALEDCAMGVHTATALNPFGTALAEHLAVPLAHQLGVKAPLAGHQLGVGQHRPQQPLEIGLLAAPQMGIEQGHLGQLQLQGGGTAVIAGHHQFGRRQGQQLGNPLQHLLLQGVLALQVALAAPAEPLAGGQKGRVFA
jgi:hypothetical protein